MDENEFEEAKKLKLIYGATHVRRDGPDHVIVMRYPSHTGYKTTLKDFLAWYRSMKEIKQ